MAIIYRSSPAHNYNDGKPKLCPVCGEQMYSWSSEKYGGDKTECFSVTCAKPVSVAMIRGDVREFSKREYGIPGDPYITYPKAEGYSDKLRDAVKALLTKWGFTNIGFIDPDENNDPEPHTVVTAVHVSPEINIAFRKAPKMQRVYVFDNKYGVVALEYGYHDKYERRYSKWSSAEYAVDHYLKGKQNKSMANREKAIVLPGRETLRQEAEKKILESRKNAVLSDIRKHISEIDSLKRRIVYEKKGIAELKAQYEKEFGEPSPLQIADEG